MIYPTCLSTTIDLLKHLPSVGEKSAERMSLSFLDYSEDQINDLCKSLKSIKSKLHPCKECGHITEGELCTICTNNNRDKSVICVLEDDKSVFAFERANNYTGTYHVLNGLISPIDKIDPDDLNIKSLMDRIKKNPECEIIVALKSTIEGEMTTLYLDKILKDKVKKVSRLSYGIPVGAEIDYLDAITLERAINDRKDVS